MFTRIRCNKKYNPVIMTIKSGIAGPVIIAGGNKQTRKVLIVKNLFFLISCNFILFSKFCI